jgi:hypothetical protein
MDSLDYNQQQYQLMEKYLYQFEQGQLELDSLINVLAALLETLQSPDSTWEENFRSEWWTLEQIYAVACDRKEAYLTQESENLIAEAVENMKSFLQSVLIKETS